jgi:phosphoribosyl 1,2-cyclic phosphodiesterase
VQKITDVIITHDHVDASGGLDDLREFTLTGTAVRIHCSERTKQSIQKRYPYLCQEAPEKGSVGVSKRWVASLEFHVLADDVPTEFTVCGIRMSTLPVEHGPGYTCLGFYIQMAPNINVAYLSDISRMYDPTMAFLLARSPLDIVVVDVMKVDEPMYMAHYSLPQALGLLAALPGFKHAFFTGMGHGVDYGSLSAALPTQYGLSNVWVGYDGVVLYDVATFMAPLSNNKI